MLSAEATIGQTADQPVVPGLPERDRCLVTVILDSFSDGGTFFPDHRIHHDRAIARGIEFAAEGSDIVDVGSESTRPGARRVPAEKELHLVIPVVRALAPAGLTVSVDAVRARVAATAVEAGAATVKMPAAGWPIQSWPSSSRRPACRTASGTGARPAAFAEAGVDPTRVVLGPGVGFATTAEHNWALLAELDALHALGHSILVGTSRNSFLGHTVAADGDIPPVAERDAATTAVSAMAAARIARPWRVARAAHQPATLGVPQTEWARYAEAGRRWP